MALLNMTEAWVGVQRRADANLRQPGWFPKAYVRLELEGTVTNIGPDNARALAKAIKFNADLIDPPAPRKRRG